LVAVSVYRPYEQEQVPEFKELEQEAAGNVNALFTHTEHLPEYCHPELSTQEYPTFDVPVFV
jgi:hypothetical protein